MFNQPSGQGFLPAKQLQGHLILFTRIHGSEMKPDSLKPGQLQRVVTADYVDLDEPGQPLHERGLVGNIGITNKLTDGAEMVLGRIGQLNTGQPQPANVLLPYDETGQDVARATAWHQAYTAGQIQKAQVQQQPSQQPYVAPQVPQQQPVQQQYPPQGQPAYGAPAAPQQYPAQQPAPQYAPPQGQQPQQYPPQGGGQPVYDVNAVQALLAQQGIGTTVQTDQPQY